jgi:hypothetical protein
MERFVPILSLLVALLAVFVGPLISLWIAKRQLRISSDMANNQIRSALEASSKQITAPMRQAWINSLRDLLAELTSSAFHYYVAGFEERTDKEYQRLTFLQSKVGLMLNPNEDDHQRLVGLINWMINSIQRERGKPDEFPESHQEVTALSKIVLKREWNVIKEPISLAVPVKEN